MSKLTFTTLKNLVNQMKENNVDKDKFSFVFVNIIFFHLVD